MAPTRASIRLVIFFAAIATWGLASAKPVTLGSLTTVGLGVGLTAANRDTLLLATSKNETLTIFKVENRKLTEIKKLPIGQYALEVFVSPDGNRAYVANKDSNSITVVDLNKLEVAATITHPHLVGPDGMAFTPDSKTLWVVSMKRNSVFEINTATNEVVREIPVDINVPRRLLLSPDRSTLYVVGNKTPAIGVVDLKAGKQVKAYKVGREPRGCLAFLPDNITLINCSVEDDTMSLVNAETGEVSLTIGVASSPQRGFIAPGGSPIYLGSRMLSGVMEIKDPYVHDDHRKVEAGKYLWGMDVSKNFKTAFVANAQDATIAIVDLVEMKVIGTVMVDKDTVGLALRE